MISSIRWSSIHEDYIISTIDGKHFKLSDMKIENLDQLFQRFVLMDDYIIVRSSERSSHETPSRYTHTLPSGYFKKNIVDLQLRSCNIPNSVYNINETNNQFVFGVGSSPSSFTTITIPTRNYTIDELCIMLEGLVALEAGVTGFSIKPIKNVRKIKMTLSSDDFQIKFDDSTCHELLGFDASSVHTSSSNILTSTRVYDVHGARLFKIGVEQLNHICEDGIQIVLRDSNQDNVIFENVEIGRINFPKIERLSAITVNIRDEQDNLVEFNGADNVFVFQITYLDIIG